MEGDTWVTDPRLPDEDEAKTRVYVRPQPVEWAYSADIAKPNRRRRSLQYTRTMTVPALRYLVGMPVMPAFAPKASAGAPVAVASVRRPAKQQKRQASRAVIGLLALIATLTLAVGIVAFALVAAEAISPQEEGSVVVSAYGVSGMPAGFKVIADGETRCEEVPCRFDVTAGEHYVTVVAPGYERASTRRVRVTEESESNLHFELVPKLK